jgi:anthranilate phosphoribosyltransferase
MVLMNAAVALVAAGVATDFRDGVARGAAAIDTGKVGELVEALRREAS